MRIAFTGICLIYLIHVKTLVELILTITIGFIVVVALFFSPVINDWTRAETQNATSPQNTNNTRMVFNVNDNTVTLINATTNETISTKTLTEITGNATTNETLADKFRELPNK